ncbi:hypothetical protein [Rhodococcus koreensis]
MSDRPPQTNAEWARDTNRRLDGLENPNAMRAGPWVMSADQESGDLIASHVDGGSVRLAKVPASDQNPDTVVVEEDDPILWENPILASGWDLAGSPASVDPVKYRKIRIAGIDMIQLSGCVHVATGTPGLIWTMPEGYRPVVNIGPILVARGFGGGSVAAQIDVRQDGTITLVGATASPGVTVDNMSGNTGAPTTNNTSWQDAGDGGSPGTFNNGPETRAGGSDGHKHWIGGHQHNMANHGHSMSHGHTASSATGFPDFLSFNGVMYAI